MDDDKTMKTDGKNPGKKTVPCGKSGIILLAFFLISLIPPRVSGNYFHTKENERILTGLDIFLEMHAAAYQGKKAVLITNHSGVDSLLRQNISLLRGRGITVNLVLAPEHGLYGYLNDYEENEYAEDDNYNLLVYNMHRLSEGSLRFLFSRSDIVIFDIQDMGMRCYTYISNLKRAMDALNGSGKELIVLDRPGPISYLGLDGAYLDKRFTSQFVSAFPSTFIYDMTIGEAALYYRGEFRKKVNLKVVPMKNYRRGMLYHETGLPWVPPSPNLPTYESSIIYAAVVLLEGTNISLGRGTPKPFEFIGAPWIEPYTFARELEGLGLHNFAFRPVYFRPTFSNFINETCGGVQIYYRGGPFSPTEFAYKIIAHLRGKYPAFRWHTYGSSFHVDYLAGTDLFRLSLEAGKPFRDFLGTIKNDSDQFDRVRKKYLLY